MISSSSTQEPATALIFSLSSLDKAKPVIGSSRAVPFLVQSLLQSENRHKLDALHSLHNLSTHPPNIDHLLDAGIVDALLFLLASNPPDEKIPTLAEKVLAIFLNIASTQAGKHEMASMQGLISSLAMILDSGEPSEQEQAVSCLLILCEGDDYCCHVVLQEGVIPALVSVSVSGGAEGREKAQRLLRLFREQRQREPSALQQQQMEGSAESAAVSSDSKPLCKLRVKKLGRTLSSFWKSRHFSVYQC